MQSIRIQGAVFKYKQSFQKSSQVSWLQLATILPLPDLYIKCHKDFHFNIFTLVMVIYAFYLLTSV